MEHFHVSHFVTELNILWHLIPSPKSESGNKQTIKQHTLLFALDECVSPPPQSSSEATLTIQWWVGLPRQNGGELNGLQREAVGWISLRLWSFSPGRVVRPMCLPWRNPAPRLQPFTLHLVKLWLTLYNNFFAKELPIHTLCMAFSHLGPY